VSFYNRESLVVQLDHIEWTPSLAARFDPNTGLLKVNFKGEEFNIPVRAYTVKEVREILNSYFDIVEISTFPTLSSLFPNSLFDSEKAKQLCTFVDNELRLNEQIAGGPYIVAVCRKRGKPDADTETLGYLKIIQLLNNNRILPNIKEHAPVISPDDVAHALGIEKSQMVKSILIRVTPIAKPGSPAHPPTKYYAVGLQASRRMDFAKVAHILEAKRDQIEVASANEVEELTGFTIGGIPPFGFPRHINVLLDQRIQDYEMVYCGTGKRTESLRISVLDLVKLAMPVVADVSKD
jgi:prolyl-tRNA editing enzyme YbaK/EbsC (Cys-tRNA(Pro) deacylase)